MLRVKFVPARLGGRRLGTVLRDHGRTGAIACFDAPALSGAAMRGRLAPEIPEPCRRKLGVADGVLNRPMPKPILQRPRVMPLVRQGVAAGVA